MARRQLALLVAFGCLLVALAPAWASATIARDTGDVAHDGGLQWGFDRINSEDGWAIGRGSGITIAVIDSGVSLGHEDLTSQLLRGTACRDTGGDPAKCAGSAQDDDGHGTHVAGIAAARTGNGAGIAGVAPDARILPIKVLFRSCADCPSAGGAEDVVAAIRWATANGADIINLSLGSTESAVFGPGFLDAINEAWDAGVVPIIAAGNQFVLTADFGDAPAIVVAATTRDDRAPSYGNGVGNARWAVSAPGGDEGDTAATCAQNGNPVGILSTFWSAGDNAAYACLAGTSMAAPHVAGAVAILLSAGYGRDQAIDLLRGTAVDLGAPGVDSVFGAGLIDLAAVARATGSTPTTIATSTTPTTAASTTSAAPTTPATGAAPVVTVDPTETTAAPGPDVDATVPAFDRADEVAGRAILIVPDDGGERTFAVVAAIATLTIAAGALVIARSRRLI